MMVYRYTGLQPTLTMADLPDLVYRYSGAQPRMSMQDLPDLVYRGGASPQVQNLGFQLPGRNYNPIPPPMNPVPPGALFNPLASLGLGVGRPPGGYTGGYSPSPGVSPPALGGGAAPGAGAPNAAAAAPGAPSQVPWWGGGATMGGPRVGSNLTMTPPWGGGATVNPGQAGASAGWTPQTAVPPAMANAGINQNLGLLFPVAPYQAHTGLPREVTLPISPPPKSQARLTPSSGQSESWYTGPASTKPPASYYDIQPGGSSGADAVTGANLPTVTPKAAPVAKPKPKVKPKPRQAQAGNQARYTGGTNWESHNEAYNPIQGSFGHQAWRRPKR